MEAAIFVKGQCGHVPILVRYFGDQLFSSEN